MNALSCWLRRRRWSRCAVTALAALAVVLAARRVGYPQTLAAVGLAAVIGGGLQVRARASRGATALLLAILAVTGAYAVWLWIYLGGRRPPDVAAALMSAAWAVVDDDVRHLGAEAHDALRVCIGLGVVSGVLGLRALFAPVRAQDGHDAAEHVRAAELVAAHGTDSIAPFVLRADKAFFFAHGGVLAYRTLRETAVVSGDPVGPEGSAPAILAAFLDFAGTRGWDVVVTSARAEHLEGYHALGLRSLCVGSEAIVEPAAFTLAGKAGRTVRKAVGRVRRYGWTVELVPAARLTPALAAEVEAVDGAWRGTQPRLYGFAMTFDRLWGAPEDSDDLYALARNPSGELRAFQRYVPYRRGLSLDAMRRLDDEPNGISDALVAAVLEHAREQGLREVSLNFAGFAHLMTAETLQLRSQRLARWALRRLHGHFQLDRLVRFTAKYHPQQRPRHLVYTGRTRLPLAALRVMQAEAYIKAPRCRLRRDAWRPVALPVAHGPRVAS